MGHTSIKAGDRFGRLTVIDKTEKRNSCGCVVFLCLCECGKQCEVPSAALKNGHTKSCGCLHDEVSRDRMINNTFWKLHRPRKIIINKYIEDGDELIVYTKQGEFRIDKNDKDLLERCRWYINKNRYVVNSKGIFIHRLIMGVDETDDVIDHIDHDTLNNTKRNLRIVSKSENAMNRKCDGVTFDKLRNKWQAAIVAYGKKYFLGRYNTKEEAILARKEGEKKYYGEYRYRECTPESD